MKNDTNGFTSFDNLPDIDPAVESLLGQGQRRQDEARLPRDERSRKKKERERAEKLISKKAYKPDLQLVKHVEEGYWSLNDYSTLRNSPLV